MIVLVANSRDFATDRVVGVLRRRNCRYLRIDLDLLWQDQVILDPLEPALRYALPDLPTVEVRAPSAILFRAPTHLRESSGHRHTPQELLKQHQWAAFARSLTVFRDTHWINHPAATFAAENKPFQLAVAAALGFDVPSTRIGNYLDNNLSAQDRIAIKALDSFLLRDGDHDLFFYTTILAGKELSSTRCRDMPVIFQTLLEPKLDMRVTVVGKECFVAETTQEVRGDWRLQKETTHFRASALPRRVQELCVSLVSTLGLSFGAIDLARSGTNYWFLEINPSGEWAWIDDLFDGGIGVALANCLLETEDLDVST